MTASDWLRSLAAEAQAGPWQIEVREGDEWWFGGGQAGMEAVIRPSSGDKWDYVAVRSGNTASDLADARLIALAPDLAVLCADAIDALTELLESDGHRAGRQLQARRKAQDMLARFAALQPENREEERRD